MIRKKDVSFSFFTIILVYLSFFACGTEENQLFSENLEDAAAMEQEKLIWVCYNPSSRRHGMQCEEDLTKEECLVPGDRGKFCWSMYLSECNEPDGILYNEICNKNKN